MKVLRQLMFVSLLVAMMGCVEQAETSSKQRLKALEKLPNWSGQWEQFAMAPNGRDLLNGEGFDAIFVGNNPPYKPEWRATIREASHANILCEWGFPTIMTGSPFSFEVLVTPEETALVFSYREVRHIYTDGNSLPSPNERWPNPWGTSVGHWEGQTLVVETVATSSPLLFGSVQEKYWFGTFSDQARFFERIRMVDKDTLENQITVEDPVALTEPWRLTRHYHRIPNFTRLVVEDCRGNDRTQNVGGTITIAPPKQ